MSAKRQAGAAPPKSPGGAKRFLPFAIIGGVLAVVLGAAVVLMRSNDPGGSSVTNTASRANTNAAAPAAAPRRSPLPGAQPAHSVGPENAPVVLEEFGDFQCPPCGRMHPVVQQIERDYGDRLRFVFRHYPLQQIHKNAFSAARAAEAAGMQGKFWEMHDIIFDNQNAWKDSAEPRTIFADYARGLGLNVEKFQADMARQEVADRVMADFQRGNSLGVSGTPTFFVNGRELPGTQALDPAYLRAQIDQALGAAGR
ncbi:MAG TPA: thioredoxin domain-containing protein [Pyrinomonadaceae bacterium]|nr:thioredoxin domain-containing protein [Pyrinomonadaceae bacterium]